MLFSFVMPDETRAALEARRARLSSLRSKLQESTTENRKDVIAEQTKQREASQRSGTAHGYKMAKAERLLDERDMRERGEDVERQRALKYTIEENEAWEKKLEEKERTRDKGMIGTYTCTSHTSLDFQDLAERSYQRQLKTLTPDLAAYAKQKEAEAQSTTTPSEQTSTALTTTSDSQQALVPAKEAKVSAAVASYGTHKPDEDSIDRLVSHLNHEYVQRRLTDRQDQIRHRSRRREDDLDVEGTYINQRNKRFNRKIQRVRGIGTDEMAVLWRAYQGASGELYVYNCDSQTVERGTAYVK